MQPSMPIFNKVWKWEGPGRTRTTLWKLAYGKLLTNVERKKRGTTTVDLCPRCKLYPETVMRMLRD